MSAFKGSFDAAGEAGSGKLTFVEEVLETREQSAAQSIMIHRRTGKPVQELEEVDLPSFGSWEWSTNWRINRNNSCDLEGWQKDRQDSTKEVRNWTRTRVTSPPSKIAKPRDSARGLDVTLPMVGGAASLKVDPNIPKTPEYFQKKIIDGLQILTEDAKRLIKLDGAVGSKDDSEQIRDSIVEQIDLAEEHISLMMTLFDELAKLEKQDLASGGPRSATFLQATRNKLSKDFLKQKSQLESIILQTKQKVHITRLPRVNVTRIHNSNPEIGIPPNSGETTNTYITREEMDQRIAQELLLDSTLDINKALIEEREAELSEINKELHQVKSMMTDVATIVKTQGEDLAKVEANADSSLKSTERGYQDIKKAERLQESNCSLQ